MENNADLQEAFRLFCEPKNNKPSPLHLIVSGKRLTVYAYSLGRNNKGQTSDLVAITDLFLEMFSGMSLEPKVSHTEKMAEEDDAEIEELMEKLSNVQLKGLFFACCFI